MQIATLSKVYIFDIGRLRRVPKFMARHVFASSREVIGFIHDVSNDNVAYHRTFCPPIQSFDEYCTRPILEQPLHIGGQILDTKAKFDTGKHSVFARVGYRLPNNRLKNHMIYALGYEPPVTDTVPDLKMFGQYFNKSPLPATAYTYMYDDALGRCSSTTLLF